MEAVVSAARRAALPVPPITIPERFMKATLMLGAVLLGAATFAPIAPAANGVVEVKIGDYKFDPPELKVKVGATVKWVNNEKRASHSVIWLGPGGFESERLFPGESYQRKFDQPGTYPYSCGPHPEMKGLVVVTE
jgi:plastocyanin